MRIANIIAAVIGMFLSATAFIITLSFKHFKNVPIGPEFFPRWLSTGLFICCAVLLIQNIVDKNNKTPAMTLSLKDKGMQRMLIGLAIIIVAAALWYVTGFIITTPFVLFAFMVLLGKREWKTMVVFSIVSTAVIFLAFKFLLGIDMPMGLLE
ncbi:tripartite tricarboxylate transporter TctB family protein [Treponema parvum]|uniref:Tripartite tricarboxylate transporter TctB family protein n=1 Tax=Treponema parvum TaxID=138851 RepID=A0A975IC28_9SPIR|nr:tripartite tricarboxylate transporter TctB family protein [Treponema parvum]QTQ11383.1 tripartite tricarboxylate transporter TctB family protein [Treponema parvum]QTQ16675.1 tripartite tricarboxylate transporter TctB family protein [Treponema parvum]